MSLTSPLGGVVVYSIIICESILPEGNRGFSKENIQGRVGDGRVGRFPGTREVSRLSRVFEAFAVLKRLSFVLSCSSRGSRRSFSHALG